MQYQHQQQYHQDAEYDGHGQNAGYLYPPSSATSGTNNNGSSNGYTEKGGYELGREHSLGGDTVAGSSMHSPYDEKLAALASASSNEIPAAIPRYPNGRPGAGHNNTKSSVSFHPGHLSRGSVALLAAAEGQIPKKEGLRQWRKDEHQGIFTAGGKRRTCMRCCCCTIILALIIIVGVVASFLLWVREILFG